MKSFFKYKLTKSGKKIEDREDHEKEREKDWVLGRK